ncbi:MAG: type II toxin-antitoxin system RelE/ParE family toxin [Candidatus Woesearchaeota archaeon]|nr:type II toxin-antitoxin system RelE/ParE family toxin [Candidatus Woesearchaeota archaeon]
MLFNVKLSAQAIKFLRKQDKHIQERIKTALQKLVEPFDVVEHFEGEDYYKFRIGDYRALVDVDIHKRVVWIRVLDIRSRIYKR